jgi:branched-chain amino acid transport system substrate-binding protein
MVDLRDSDHLVIPPHIPEVPTLKSKAAYSLSAVAILALVTACGAPGAATTAEGPIKVAIIPPSSGALAEFGSGTKDGWKYAVDEVNARGGIDGRQVELTIKDTDGTAATTLQAVQEVVTQDGINLIGGIMTSTEHGAVNQQLEGLHALSFNSNGKDDALTGAACKRNAFRTVTSNRMDIKALGDALKDLPGDKWAIQAVDYSTGHDAAQVFKAAAEAAGKQVVLEQFAPLNTTEFGTYITKLKDSGADALFSAEYGADGVAFINQSDQFKLMDQFKTVLGFNMVSEPLFKTLGDRVLGFYNNVGYDLKNTSELNQKFVKGFEASHGSKPYYVQTDAYLSAQTLFAGIDAANSTDTEAVRTALQGLTFDSVVGKVTMRADDHQLLRPSYLGKVVKGNAGLEFEIARAADPSVTSPAANEACQL